MNPRALAPLLVVCLFSVSAAQAAIWDTPIIIEQGQVVPPSGSPGVASGMFVLDTDANILQFNLQLDQPLQGNEVFAGVFGPADLGQNGPLLFQLPNGWPKIGNWAYPDSLEPILLANLTYCQIDTDVHFNGEIRGQLAAWQAQGLTQQDAIDYFTQVILPPHVGTADFSAHLIGLGTTDTLLVGGDVVADYDSNFVFTVPGDMYLFWVDEDPLGEWFHDTTFFFIDAFSGQMHVEPGESWPVINNDEYIMTDSDNVGCKIPPRLPLLPDYPKVAHANTDAWALIVVGKNGRGKTTQHERDARKNDIERIEQYLNGTNKGPKVDGSKILLAAGADTMGTTLAEVCAKFDQMNGCSKIYFFYVGHGSQRLTKRKYNGKKRRGYMILKKTGSNRSDEFSYYELACKLLEKKDVKEVCVTIEACYAGRAVHTFKNEIPAEKEKQLKGSLATSSRAMRKTRRDVDGAFFIKSFFLCSQSAASDLNNDAFRTPSEAAAWAELTDPIVQIDDPQVVSLGDSDALRMKKTEPIVPKPGDGGRREQGKDNNIQYTLHRYTYVVKGSAGQDSCVTRVRVVARNPHNEVFKAGCRVRWQGTKEDKNNPAKWDTVAAPFQFYPKDHLKCNWVYLGEMDPKNTCIRVRKVANKGSLGPGIAAFPDSVTLDRIHRTTEYRPGEHIVQDFELRGNAGDQFDVTLVDGPGWGLTVDHVEFAASATGGSLPFAVRGDVPMNATNGGRVQLQVANLSCPDTLLLEFDALIYDSLATAEGPGTRSFEGLDMHFGAGLDATGGIIDWDNTSMRLRSSGVATVPSGGSFVAFESQMAADQGQTVDFDVSGKLRLEHFTLAHPLNGLELQSPDSTMVLATYIGASAGDGLSVAGDLSLVETDLLFIDDAADDGVEAQGVSNAALDAVIITNSGDQDVVVENNSTLLLRNCYFDDTKVTVDGTSQLTRSWSVGISVEDTLGNALDLAVVEVRDALNNLVASFSTDDDGFSPILELNEWEQNGAVRTAHTPHSVLVMRGNVSENFVVNIDDKDYPVLVMSQVVSDVGDDLPQILSMAQNAPNPFGAPRLGTSTRIAYALPGVSDVRLQVYDVRGRMVTERKVVQQRAGWHHFDLSAQSMASGVYWYELRTIQGTERRKMIVIK